MLFPSQLFKPKQHTDRRIRDLPNHNPYQFDSDSQYMLASGLGLVTRKFIPATMKSEALLGRIGVIADVQYVDQEDGFDFSGVQRRRYRNSIEVLRRAVNHWNG